MKTFFILDSFGIFFHKFPVPAFLEFTEISWSVKVNYVVQNTFFQMFYQHLVNLEKCNYVTQQDSMGSGYHEVEFNQFLWLNSDWTNHLSDNK